MAFHEQHERSCPTCGERISATAPKCFNCGERVDDDDEDDEEEGSGIPRIHISRGVMLALVGVVVGAALIAYLGWGRGSDPKAEAEADAQRLHQMLGQQAGRSSLNSSSPLSLAEVEPHLHTGMPLQELFQIISSMNTGRPLVSTTIGTVPLPGDGDAESGGQGYFIYLRDANLTVRTDTQENVVSWRSEPVE